MLVNAGVLPVARSPPRTGRGAAWRRGRAFPRPSDSLATDQNSPTCRLPKPPACPGPTHTGCPKKTYTHVIINSNVLSLKRKKPHLNSQWSKCVDIFGGRDTPYFCNWTCLSRSPCPPGVVGTPPPNLGSQPSVWEKETDLPASPPSRCQPSQARAALSPPSVPTGSGGRGRSRRHRMPLPSAASPGEGCGLRSARQAVLGGERP